MPHRHAVRPLLSACLGVALAAACLLPVSPASAAEPWQVPDHATISLDGRGNGHGHGMSQYGAEGAAREGLGYRDIIGFYYPGTNWGTASGSVTVLITRDTSRDVVVDPRSGLTVRSLGLGRTWPLPAKVRKHGPGSTKVDVRRWRITPAPNGHSAVSYRTGAWHEWKVARGDAEFAAGGKPVTLRTPVGPVAYRGALRSATPAGSTSDRDTVNVVGLDAYLRGVVPSEVIASTWHADAIRAQAVAARTYAAYERAHAPSARHYELCDTAHCQVYGGYSAEYPTSNAAVSATGRQVITSGGDPAFAQFSASNGGWTAAGDFDYLPAQEDRYDGWTDAGHQTWSTTVTSEEIEKAYNIEDLKAISIATRDGNGQWGGRAETVDLTTAKGDTYSVTGESFRSHLGLRSTWFEITAVAPR
ncbi:MAG: SpoIID/LytB domain [Nocardioides sp.]|nr:SpoIID/LytB domain [Nocardioides sp.]